MIDQRLDLHQQRAGPFPDHHHRATGGDFISPAEEDSGRVAHFAQALLGHGEDAQLVHRAKAVFMAAQRAEAESASPSSSTESSRYSAPAPSTGQRAVSGDVADHITIATPRVLCVKARQIGRGFPYLGDAVPVTTASSAICSHPMESRSPPAAAGFFIGDLTRSAQCWFPRVRSGYVPLAT